MKKYLIFGILCFSLLFMCGCKKENEKKVLTEEQFYEKLVLLNQNSNDVNQYTVTGQIKASFFMMTETTHFETTVDLENNRYAYVNKDNSGNILDSEYVIKEGDDYIKYTYESEESTGEESSYEAEYVGKDYVKMNLLEESIGLETLDLSSYESFKESFSKMSESVIEEEMSYENIPYNTTVELYEENGLYFFDSLIAVKDFSLGENGLMNGAKVSFSLQSQMKFNEEYLVGITIKYSVTYDLEDGKITTAISYTSNYEKGFKESLITNDFSDYPTEIKAADFDVSYIVDGENMYIETKNYKNGQTFVVDYENNVENTYIDNWFLDKANTIGISNLEDYPSYDVTLYAVTKPNEGYGLVILKGVANYSGGWQMYLSVEREAFLANEQYVIPNVIEHWGNDMNVSNVKVNGETYTQQTITIENRSVYVIEVELTEISE